MCTEAGKRSTTYTLEEKNYSLPGLKVAYNMQKLNLGLTEIWLQFEALQFPWATYCILFNEALKDGSIKKITNLPLFSGCFKQQNTSFCPLKHHSQENRSNPKTLMIVLNDYMPIYYQLVYLLEYISILFFNKSFIEI